MSIGKLTIDCPLPPSMNRIWRYGRGRVYKDQKYTIWMHEFHWHLRNSWPLPVTKPWTVQPFEIEILIHADRRRDLDNCVKAVLDACQSHEVIKDDALAQEILLKRVPKEEAPLGCRIIIMPLGKL